MKALKNRKGFSLVELIVVIVILGILAAIAVPNLIGFINRTNVSADIAAADGLSNTAKAVVMTLNARGEAAPATAAELRTVIVTDGFYTDNTWPRSKISGQDMEVSWVIDEPWVTNGGDIGTDNVILPVAGSNGEYERTR